MLLLAALVLALTTFPAAQSPAEMMATIADPPWREMARVQKRFEYLLPRFVSSCPDIDAEIRAADMIVVAFNAVHEAGIDEGLVELSEGLYGIARHANSIDLRGQCAEYFAMYAVLRQEGMSPRDATEGLKDLLTAFR